MPIISQSSYQPHWPFTNPHVQTVFPTLFRKVTGVRYRRERIETPDGDFIDLDFSETAADKAVVILHGLEGDSSRNYVLGMVKAFNQSGRDAVAMNFRGCSGECNGKLRFYHSGDTADLHTVVTHLSEQYRYSQVALIGFSLGGNVVLKYLGERGDSVLPEIRKAAAFSVPCDLASSSNRISEPSNRIYLKRFLRMLRKKIRMKMQVMPDFIDDRGYETIRSFKEFDDRYTAPMNGFKNAEDYWEKSSCKPFLTSIAVPTILISAADDPFLPDSCYPRMEALENPFLSLEIPGHGGHVGFVAFTEQGRYWSESRAVEFVNA
ncbi:MAG: alpha/beta fold hydrolase [Desulfomonilaceae bacterium]|nr:alpha/beta fold hydrolase [Desulfomonilaceae bacterium]